ncbi:MAG: LamB/YcsF family protein [Candidatus Bathyarchaeia archaeon]
MRKKTYIVCDMGENFGIYKVFRDEEIMPLITTANIACGFHAGDPRIMRKTVLLARKHGVQIGAHTGLPDREGFGRRWMRITSEEAQDYVTYQISALQGFAKAYDAKVEHILPHGIFWDMAAKQPEIAEGVVRAIKETDPKLVVLARGSPITDEQYLHDIAIESGVKASSFFVVDLPYNQDGRLVVERSHELEDPAIVAKRCVRVMAENKVDVLETGIGQHKAKGSSLDFDPEGILIHSDTPNAPEILQAVRTGLAEAGIEIVPLRELK